MINEAPLDRSLLSPGLLALDAAAIAEQFGTPTFVYDEDEIRRRCREYVAGFGPESVAYAGKAFLCTAMARVVAEEGLHLDCATGGEMYVALHAGIPGDAHRAAREQQVRGGAGCGAARRASVVSSSTPSTSSTDSRCSVRERRVRQSVLVRVTPGVEAHTHEYIETGTEASKFGFTLTDGVALAAVRRVIECDGLHLAGLHCHIGSQIYRLDAFGRAIERLAGPRGRAAPHPRRRRSTSSTSGVG